MDNDERRRNQERWMSDEVRVLVGTIAFGLGINKANVRAVIHLALPKSVEQFYQEAGRAGRDGKPADCLLLWRKQDAGLLGYFANQILDSAERDRAWQRYHKIREFAESRQCRHRQICTHFGETPKWDSCNACDVCGSAPGWLTIAESRSAVRQVFTGKATSAPPSDSQIDLELREYLREWRRLTAKERSMPAFVVLHDTTLEEICRVMPSSVEQLRTITGIGERKAALFGQGILTALIRFKEGARAAAAAPKKTAPAIETLQLISQGKTLSEIAEIRGRQLGTVINAVATLLETGDVEFHEDWIDRNKQAVIEAACNRMGLKSIKALKPLKDVLPPEVTYDEIRLVLAQLRREQTVKPERAPT
jgi:ATP-dependent DNA helicase RecQ